MQTRILVRGTQEAYNTRVRIRLQVAADKSSTVITVFFLKPNGFYYRKVTMRVPYTITLNEVVDNYQVLLTAA